MNSKTDLKKLSNVERDLLRKARTVKEIVKYQHREVSLIGDKRNRTFIEEIGDYGWEIVATKDTDHFELYRTYIIKRLVDEKYDDAEFEKWMDKIHKTAVIFEVDSATD